MEALTWTGPVGTLLNPMVSIVTVLLAITIIVQICSTMIFPTARGFNADGSLQVHATTHLINLAVKYCFYVTIWDICLRNNWRHIKAIITNLDIDDSNILSFNNLQNPSWFIR